ncbi:hypothetical protein JL721_2321 [Aureococcus anophagefferens]|nr:hypothetical protein JL721_2321 [Aureococcus anophagefferens]
MGLPSWPGLRGLYVGLAAPILGNVPFWACYFASYRAAQRHVAPYFGDDTAAAQLAVGAVAGAASAVALTPIDAVKVTAQVDQVFFYAHDAASRRGWSPFLAGGLAGVAEWTFILPVDTVKTRFTMLRHASLAAVVRGVWREGGVPAFYRGLGPTLARSFPANGAAFVCIDGIDRYCFRDAREVRLR